MKILVLGATGMAGHVITLYFKERGHNVTALVTRPVSFCKYIIVDANDKIALNKHILVSKYDAVINCIGILNQFASMNKTDAIYLNSYLPHFIAKILKETDTKLIHMSTDCVFAGNTGPYYEISKHDGNSFYDRTKSLGEVIDSKNLTFRNSIIGPDIKINGIGLFNWFMNQSAPIYGYTGAIWTGVSTITLAKAMERSLEVNLNGLYNLVNNTSISKYELLKLFNKHFRNDEMMILPSDDLKLDKTLKCSRNDFDFTVPSYEEMVIEIKEWVNNHKNLYSNYK